MTLILDAGAFVAWERGKSSVAALLKVEWAAERVPVTHAGVIGQVWRGGAGRQAGLAKLLGGIDVRPLDEPLGRRAGMLLGAVRRRDVVDAALVLLARDGDVIVTSDPDDIVPLAIAADLHVDVVEV